MLQKITKKEGLLAKARQPAEDATRLHPFYQGKMQTVPKCVVRNFNDFANWYTPGVTDPCHLIRGATTIVFSTVA